MPILRDNIRSMDDIFVKIEYERCSQQRLWGSEWRQVRDVGERHYNYRKLSVLIEEVGEVAVAWLEAFEDRKRATE